MIQDYWDEMDYDGDLNIEVNLWDPEELAWVEDKFE